MANDARNRVAMYKGALRQRQRPSAAGLLLSTGSSGTGSSSGSSTLHDRPLVSTSGGKLMVLYNSNDNNNNNNNNNNNSPSPPVAACYDLNILIPTLYPDLDIPLPVGCPFFFPLSPSLSVLPSSSTSFPYQLLSSMQTTPLLNTLSPPLPSFPSFPPLPSFPLSLPSPPLPLPFLFLSCCC